MKRFLFLLGKIAACGIIFFIGNILGSVLAGMMGLPAPAAPKGSDPARLMIGLLGVSIGMGALLSYLSSRMYGGFLTRWLSLASFGWVIYALTTNIEAAIYTTFSSASTFKLVMDLVAFLLCALLAAWFFHPSGGAQAGLFRQWSASRTGKSWRWRFLLAWAAFPVIYLSFGKVVEPFVIEVYRQGQLEMAAPGWELIIPVQILRSLIFMVICLPLIIYWNGSRRSLWTALAAAQFLLVGGFYMVQAYWFPVDFRLVHSLEILSDSAVYSTALVLLLCPPVDEHQAAKSGNPAGVERLSCEKA